MSRLFLCNWHRGVLDPNVPQIISILMNNGFGELKDRMSIYEKIKAELAQSNYIENFPNEGQRFIAWYLRNIHNLDTHEAKD